MIDESYDETHQPAMPISQDHRGTPTFWLRMRLLDPRGTGDLRRYRLPLVACAYVHIKVTTHAGNTVLGLPRTGRAHEGHIPVKPHVDLVEPILGQVRRLGRRPQEGGLVENRSVGFDADELIGKVGSVPLDVSRQGCRHVLLVQSAQLL